MAREVDVMLRTVNVTATALLALVLGAAGSFAQSAPTSFYVLLDGSSFAEGCFPPCLCPVFQTGDVHGAFQLVPLPPSTDWALARYAVRDVSWRIKEGADLVPVTGSGTYERGGSATGEEQRLVLDLAIGGAAPQHFDSGIVPVVAKFPLIDATVSLHGGFCFDTEFHVRAAPKPGCQ